MIFQDFWNFIPFLTIFRYFFMFFVLIFSDLKKKCFWDFSFSFYLFFGFLGFLSKLLMLLLKVTKVITGHKQSPKAGQNSIRTFLPEEKKSHGRMPHPSA